MLFRYCKTILTAFLFFFRPDIIHAQSIERFNTFSYSVNEGLLQSTMFDIAIDKNNFCWISFPNGIQKFDGENFTTVPVQPGLPDDKNVLFFRCSNGDLFISHSQGISKYELNSNRFVQVYASRATEKTAAQFIGEDGGAIYFYSPTGNITCINSKSLKIISEIKTGFPDHFANSNYSPKISDNIINHKVVMIINSALYLWDLQKGKLISRSDPIADMSFYLLRLTTENTVLYFSNTITNALQLYNFATNTKTSLFVKGKDNKIIYRCSIFPWQNKILLSFNNRLYATDSTLQTLKSELVNFQNQPMAGSHSINKIKEDNFSNLYIQTNTGGIKKIIRNNYPFKYYSTGKADSNFIISILPDKKNNRILAGTSGNGLLVFDTLQQLIKHIKTLPGRNMPATVSNIIKTNKGSYLLFIVGENRVWELKHDFSNLKSIPISTTLPENKTAINYFGNVLFQNEQEARVQTQNNIYKIDLASNIVTHHTATTGSIMSSMLYNNTIITHTNDELVFLDVTTFKEVKKVPFKNTGNVRCFTKDKTGNIYVGSNKGIFKIDSIGKILLHLTKENGLPDECIYAMTFDNADFLWCSTNKGILKINKDNSFQQFKKEDGLQENEFNTNAVATADDGELFFGGINGLSSFYPNAISGFNEKISILVTGIKVNNEEFFKDTATWSISEIKLPYLKNSLSFDFVAMGNSNPGQYIYQYRMKGVEKDWIQNNGMQTLRYFLPPGKYTLQLYASRAYDKDAVAMKEIEIMINPPFWKTWWFITVIALLAGVGLAYAVNRYNRRKYQEKLLRLEAGHKLQLERERISRDLHDSVGAYANAVLYNTELLQKDTALAERNELMNDLRFASKDIITSLRETVWALKKDKYTAEECLMRIKNFVQSLARYYPHIHFKVYGEASSLKILQHANALNVVRIVQEAVTNSIKHAVPGKININSKIVNESWELTVIDDGKSFNYEEMQAEDWGNGLKNMQKRAVESGFVFEIFSNEETGTKVRVVV